MITAIVFSRDRACQLDLLLRSIEQNAASLYSRVHVIWYGSGEYAACYRACAAEHEWAEFVREDDLRRQTFDRLDGAPCVAFLMDDCVFYRQLNGQRRPESVLDEDEDVLCFSPRLGLNTTYCYPLRREQARPLADAEDGVVYWEWQEADADFAYPASLDGHVFRSEDIEVLLRDAADWRTPNTVEARLADLVRRLERPVMAAHVASSLVGVPANRTSPTHEGNRFGELHPSDPAELNRRFLAGDRLSLSSVDPDSVNAAHVEFPLRFA